MWKLREHRGHDGHTPAMLPSLATSRHNPYCCLYTDLVTSRDVRHILSHSHSCSRTMHYHLDSVQTIGRKHVLSFIGLQAENDSSEPQDGTSPAWPEFLVFDPTIWNSPVGSLAWDKALSEKSGELNHYSYTCTGSFSACFVGLKVTPSKRVYIDYSNSHNYSSLWNSAALGAYSMQSNA